MILAGWSNELEKSEQEESTSNQKNASQEHLRRMSSPHSFSLGQLAHSESAA